MPTVNIVCGEFHPGPCAFYGHCLTLQPLDLDKPLLRVACSHLREVECVGCEESLSLASALVWGVAGLLVMGPLGALLGVALCGRRTEVTFKARLRDGRAFVAVASARTFRRLCSSQGARSNMSTARLERSR